MFIKAVTAHNWALPLLVPAPLVVYNRMIQLKHIDFSISSGRICLTKGSFLLTRIHVFSSSFYKICFVLSLCCQTKIIIIICLLPFGMSIFVRIFIMAATSLFDKDMNGSISTEELGQVSSAYLAL